MTCNGCGSQVAARINGFFDRTTKRYTEICDLCGNVAPVWLPDVVMSHPAEFVKNGYVYNPNICNRETGKPIPFSTKREKAVIMKQLGIREAGDFYHGARHFDKGTKDKNLF